MNAYQIPNLRFSGVAGFAVDRYRFVQIYTDGTFRAGGVAGEVIIGVSQNTVAAEEILEVADGIVMVAAASSVTYGDPIKCANGGKATKWNDATDAEEDLIGVALTAGNLDEIITVKLFR